METVDLETDALRTLVAVVEAGGFTAAAGRLGRTQSAVSMKVKRLEDQVGRRLLSRTSRSVALTPEGEALVGYARRILALNDEAVGHLLAPTAGSLRLGVAEYFAPIHLPGILARFRRAWPNLLLDVRVDSTAPLLEQLEAGDLDLVVGKRGHDPREGGGSQARGRVVWREPLVWVAGAEWHAGETGPVPLCLMPSPCAYRGVGIQALEGAGRPWQTVYTSPSIFGVRAAAQAGLGATVLGVASLGPGLRMLTADEGFPTLPPGEIAVFGEDRLSRVARPAAKAFVEFLLQALAAGLAGTERPAA